MTVNLLGIPEEIYGETGIKVGNEIYKALQAAKYLGRFNPLTQRITVLYSSKLSLPLLSLIIFDPSHSFESNEYEGWVPYIEPKRDKNRNWEIGLNCAEESLGSIFSRLSAIKEESSDEKKMATGDKV